jgi:hypothetical protein
MKRSHLTTVWAHPLSRRIVACLLRCAAAAVASPTRTGPGYDSCTNR